MEISIHRALAELKLLDKRITKLIKESLPFCAVMRNEDKNIGTDTLDDYRRKIESNFDSINSLIERREQIKSKIMTSNATTKVVVAGEQMTVVEAIEKKNNIMYKEDFLKRLRQDLHYARQEMDMSNTSLPDRLESFLKSTLGDNPSPKDVEALSQVFTNKNEVKLFDPLNIDEKIAKLEKEIDDFLMEVDFILSESNSRTTIEID